MHAFCPLCARDDETANLATPEGQTLAICSNSSHGSDGFVWDPTPPELTRIRSDGIGAELGIWEKLLECVPDDGESHAYGVVEDRLFERYPGEARTLQTKYGHKWRDGIKADGAYSMSVYLSLRLRELDKEGDLEVTWGPAEGSWAYLGQISYWKRA